MREGEWVECDACGGSGRGFGAFEDWSGRCLNCDGKGETWSEYVPEGEGCNDDNE